MSLSSPLIIEQKENDSMPLPAPSQGTVVESTNHKNKKVMTRDDAILLIQHKNKNYKYHNRDDEKKKFSLSLEHMASIGKDDNY
jgi:hypothetical protein